MEQFTPQKYILKGDENGNITVKQFLEWLNSFMVYGSDQKVLRCGAYAAPAITALANRDEWGFRITSGNLKHNLETPFGMALVILDSTLPSDKIVAEDTGIPDDPRIKDWAESSAYGIRSIS